MSLIQGIYDGKLTAFKVDVEGRLLTVPPGVNETIQAFTAVPILAAATSTSAWQDVDQARELGLTVAKSGVGETVLALEWSNNGVDVHGQQAVLTATNQYKSYNTKKSARYVRMTVTNNTVGTLTVDGWIYKINA